VNLDVEAVKTVYTNDVTVINGLPHLYQLSKAVVIAEISDYQSILKLKDLGLHTLISNVEADFIVHSYLASLLAEYQSKPILHFYSPSINISKNNVVESKLNDIIADFKVEENQAEEEAVEQPEIDFKTAVALLNKHKVNYVPFDIKNGKTDLAIIQLGSYFEPVSKSTSATVVNIKALPLELEQIIASLGSKVTKIAILEQSSTKPVSKFSNFLLEFFQVPTLLVDNNIEKITTTSVADDFEGDFKKLLSVVESNISQENPLQNLYFGKESQRSNNEHKNEELNKIHGLESQYFQVLEQLFGQNLNILNSYSKDKEFNEITPEFGFGTYLYHQEKQQELINKIHAYLNSNSVARDETLVKSLSNWLIHIREGSAVEHQEVVSLIDLLSKEGPSVNEILPLQEYLYSKQDWLISSDSWSYDLGSSGLHNILQSQQNINLLIIDNETFQTKEEKTNLNIPRKKDIGLYAINYGNAYVGSIAIYSSYTQVLTTLIEASKFNGPSIVLAYLPITTENDSHLDILKETKKSVDSGFIPLYRYNPLLEDKAQFKLDSTVIKENLKNFLDRENKLTLLSSRNPQFARSLVESQSSRIAKKQKKHADEAYANLLEGLTGAPISIYFASDGGTAESLAKKLGKRASQRGLKPKVLSMDDIILEDLPLEENILFITSTAGQGEIPQNGKQFWDAIKNSGDLDLEFSKISVFGLGDSLYWPRPQDKHYYNKPAQDIFNKLTLFNAKVLVELGLGDDQDPDGYQTGYDQWEAKLWKALGVDDVETADEPPPITNEDIKIASNYLRGTIAEELQDESTGAIASSDQQLTKFHGIYMQDDRDLRDARKAAGLEPFYIFMARVRLPGGITYPNQWLALDKLADQRGNGTIKLTTRATFQLHGIVKHNLKPSIRAMNSVLMDTLGACGDVNRNVMISALPGNTKVHGEVGKAATKISEHLLPQTTAYHEIWLKGDDPEDDDPEWPNIFEQRKDGPKKISTIVAGNALQDNEPFYGATYLPRKYKINITVPPFNDVDVWSSDVGLIAIVENNTVVGFNVLVGGGMGSTHNNKKTYPRTGSMFGFASYDQIHLVCEKIMLVQRDFGNRKDRKNARLKYTVDTLGVEVYKQKVEELWGSKFEEARSYEIKDNFDHFGWITDETGKHHFTCFIENGRVEDTPELPQKSGLKKIAEYFQTRSNSSGTFRLTGNQHVLISSVSDEELPVVKDIMSKYKLDNTNFSGLRLSSAACVAFPTCGLAMAESERYLPVLITKLEEALEEYGLRHDAIVMRMTGCPNGCARPWLAEIALVGKAYGTYNLMLGGGFHGQRLNKIFRQSIKEEEVLAILKPLFKRWALEREDGEHFGDFCIRIGEIKPTLEGKYFHDDVPEQI
jgi:sulfite reductase (NADPH) hemoprotein beta-component